MFDNIIKFFKKFGKSEKGDSKDTAKERLHLVLAQDRANISADFLEMMKQEIIEVIKKYIDIDEEAIDVRLTNKPGEDGVVGAPSLYANIPIVTIKNEARKIETPPIKEEPKKEESIEEKAEVEQGQEKETEQPEENKQEANEETKEESIDKQEANKEEKEEPSQEVSEEKIENKEVKNEKKDS